MRFDYVPEIGDIIGGRLRPRKFFRPLDSATIETDIR